MKNRLKNAGSLWLVASFLLSVNAMGAVAFVLEGQNKGDTTNWLTGNLQAWQELDYIPCRVRITGGSVASQTFTISFPHLTGTIPGFENISGFTKSANVVFLTPPTLNAPLSGDWSYSFTVQVTNSNTATIQFLARLAAGEHLNSGGFLTLGGTPGSIGSLQVQKPSALSGAPNLALSKIGPTNAVPGELVTYTLVYTNQASGTNLAHGAQITDVLPPQLIPLTNNLGGGALVGHTIFWDLGNVAAGAGGVVSFQARVHSTAAIGQSITNFAQVLSAEDDADAANNSATLTAAITCFPQVDVMLVIDRSGSMQGTPYSNARAACSNFVDTLHYSATATNSDQAGLVSYSSSASLDQTLTNNPAQIKSSTAALPAAGGNTSISSGLQTAQQELASARHNAKGMPVIILLSDGVPNGDTVSNVLYQANLAKAAGTRIFTIGLGGVDPVLMSDVASSTNDYFYTTNSADLSALFNAISAAICRTPTNISGPYSLTLCPGETAEFSVSAAGCAFTYQWRKNTSPLPGKTAETLTIPNVTNSDAGIYSVVVSSSCKTQTNSALLTVHTNVSLSGLINRTNCTGDNLVLSSTVAGTGPISLQWTKDGVLLADQTNSTLSLNSVTTTNAGNYSLIAIGACGAPVTNTAAVYVTPDPSIACQPDKTIEAGQAWTFNVPTGNYAITTFSTTTNPGCGPSFTATRTWRATDACGNFATCSQTVTVVDTTAPSLTCAVNRSVECGSAWTFTLPTASDGTTSVLSTVTNAGCGNTFSATCTWRASDECGNSSECSQTITVVDTTAPNIQCAALKTIEFGGAWDFDQPTAEDVCGTNGITILSTITNNNCGNTYAATRTWQATDACGNTAQCSQTVDVVDTTPPVIECAGAKSIESGSAWEFDLPTATDIGGTNAITVRNTVTNSEESCGSTFTATRTWRATDACGNASQCSQTVTVIDTTAPVITCATNKTEECGASWSFDPPTASDGSIAVFSTITNGACGNTFSATCTWEATDDCGNASQCSQTVTVLDTTAPAITCAPAKTIEAGAAWSFEVTDSNDLCGTNSLAILTTITNAGCGSTFTAIRTWQATDACGNTAQCSQTVTVVDTTAPSINCAGNRTIEKGVAWNFEEPAISEGTLSILSTTTNALVCTETNTRTWQVVDACGNAAQCSQTVTLVDTTAPTVSIITPTNNTLLIGPANITVLADAHDLGGPIKRVEFFNGTNKLGEATLEPFFTVLTNVPVGDYFILARAEDNCGHATTSAPVNISVLGRPPLTVLSSMRLNLATSLYEQRVRVTNPTFGTIAGVRIYVQGLTTNVTVNNKSGTTNGIPFVQSLTPLPPGGHVDFLIEYFTTGGSLPNPTLVTEALGSGSPGPVILDPIRQHVQHGLKLPNTDFLLEFATLTNRIYYVQYSSDLIQWKTATPAVTGNGTWYEWVDGGQPKTESHPRDTQHRFYRVILIP